MLSFNPLHIRGVVFDAYGTLLDVYAIGQQAESFFPGQGVALANVWRDKQIEYSRLVSLSDPNPGGSRHYQDFWRLTEAALHYAVQRLGLHASTAQMQALLGQYARLPAFEECAGVLAQLSNMGLPLAVLSNGSPNMLASATAHAGLRPHLGHVISVDSVRQFKTSPSAYALAEQTLGIPTADLLFVSSNGWDIMGAAWFGFVTCWINRAGLPRETLGPAPHHEGRSLHAVLDIVRLRTQPPNSD